MGARSETLSKFFGTLRRVGKAFEKRAQIEAGAGCQDRQFAAADARSFKTPTA